jgi:hypothetical protein
VKGQEKAEGEETAGLVGRIARDWHAIRLAFEAGETSVRELARRHGVSNTAIHKRAKAENWSSGLHQGLQSPETPLVNQPANQGADHPPAPVQTKVQTAPDFSWDPENEDVIVPDQLALAVYRNHWGQVVIRQERAWDEEDDVYVRINMESLPKVIARLQRLLDGKE